MQNSDVQNSNAQNRDVQNSDSSPELPVALVLGAAVWPGGKASPSLRRRAEHAGRLYRAGKIRGIIGCGGVGKYPPSEAHVVCEICRKMGVPQRALWQEGRSTNTDENIRFALPILERLGANPVLIVTDPYHAPRAKMVARRYGLSAQCDSPKMNDVPMKLRFKACLREAVALVWYRLKRIG